MNNVLDNFQRGKTITLIFQIYLVILILSIVSDIMQLNLISSNTIRFSAANSNDRRQIMVLLIVTLIGILSAIYFIMWFRRAYHNLHKAGYKNLAYSEGWAAGTWFVPIMNLFVPFQIMKEIWNKTNEYIKTGDNHFELDEDTHSIGKVNTQINIWWAFYIGASFCGIAANAASPDNPNIQEVTNSTYFSIAGDISSIISLIFIIMIIKSMMVVEKKFLNVWKESPNDQVNILDSDDEILI